MPAAPRFLRVILLLSGVLLALPAMADSVDELRGLVDANDIPAAWGMAARMEPDHAGDPEFDFWYGMAARAAGQRQQAVFAFERVVMTQPGNARAKLELADAYQRMGKSEDAKRLFEEVLATAPPEPVQQRIRTYLGAMGSAGDSTATKVSGYLAVAGGHDSNVSSATDVSDHDIVIGNIVRTIALVPQSLASDAAFAEFRGGIDIVQPVNQRTVRFLGINAQRRDNEDIFSGGNFDYTAMGVTGGWMLRRGAATWRIPLGVQALWAESESVGVANDDRYSFSAGLEYNRPLSARTAVTWFGQAGNAHYPSEENRNLWQLRLGTGYTWHAAEQPLRLTSTLMLATEPTEERAAAARPNGRDYVAVRGGLRWGLSAVQSINASLGLQWSAYHEPVFFSTWGEREDLLVDVSTGWQWQPVSAWTINVDVAYGDNESRGNALYDYSRTQFKAGATWRF